MSIPVTISKVLAVAVANVAWVRRLRNAVIGIVAMAAIGAGAVVATATPALACTPAPGGGCYNPKTYYVSGTDGRLAMESAPAPGHFVSWIGEGQPVQVVCQVNFGKQTDGLSSHTWDYIVGNEWVYDSYVTT